MQLNEYQQRAAKYDCFSEGDWPGKTGNYSSPAFISKVLGLSGESGEVTDKIKKVIRDKNGLATPEDHAAIQQELGDVLWYVATVARYLEIPLGDLASANLAKLESRFSRSKLHGEGDNR